MAKYQKTVTIDADIIPTEEPKITVPKVNNSVYATLEGTDVGQYFSTVSLGTDICEAIAAGADTFEFEKGGISGTWHVVCYDFEIGVPKKSENNGYLQTDTEVYLV